MSKERLERIKRESKGVVWNTETDEDLLTELDTPDFNWLIEQVEHSIPIKEHNKILLEFRVQNEQLLKQNKRYRNRMDYTKLKLRDFRKDANTIRKLSRDRIVQREAFNLSYDIRNCLETLESEEN